jgi:hypothetical protein
MPGYDDECISQHNVSMAGAWEDGNRKNTVISARVPDGGCRAFSQDWRGNYGST